MTGSLTRREFAAFAGAAAIASPALAQDAALLTRAIPSTGEALPAVGLGTAYVFDKDGDKAGPVIQALLASGGRLIDTASTYGTAESVLGGALTAGLRDKVFLATKLEAPDASELKRSLTFLKTPKVDLLQLHNVRSANQSLAQFKAWKADGTCRYIGVTSTFHNDFAALEATVRREKPDFVQIDYSVDNREAEKRILPAAADAKAAVLTALPFGRNRLFRAVKGKELPDWGKEFAASWAQFFLKFLLGDERITAVIPGTSDPAHMTDNAGAMRGRLPTADERKRMVAFVEAL